MGFLLLLFRSAITLLFLTVGAIILVISVNTSFSEVMIIPYMLGIGFVFIGIWFPYTCWKESKPPTPKELPKVEDNPSVIVKSNHPIVKKVTADMIQSTLDNLPYVRKQEFVVQLAKISAMRGSANINSELEKWYERAMKVIGGN